jgi:hypothetical protein
MNLLDPFINYYFCNLTGFKLFTVAKFHQLHTTTFQLLRRTSPKQRNRAWRRLLIKTLIIHIKQSYITRTTHLIIFYLQKKMDYIKVLQLILSACYVLRREVVMHSLSTLFFRKDTKCSSSTIRQLSGTVEHN